MAARKRTGSGPAPGPASGDSFPELLMWHMAHGTRPSGVPGVDGVAWAIKEFAYACNVSERTVTDWRSGRTLPTANYEAITRAFFGENPAFTEYRNRLRKAFNDAKQAGGSEQGTSPEENAASDRGERLRALGRDIAAILARSPEVMEALERRIRPPSTPATSEENRAACLTHALLYTLSFTNATSLLSEIHKEFRDTGNVNALRVVVEVSHYLLPVLFVSSAGLPDDMDSLFKQPTLIDLPIGLNTFAELIMAGTDVRPAEFDENGWHMLGFPRGALALSRPPEQGLRGSRERSLRADLFSILVQPEYAERLRRAPEQQQDDMINHRLGVFLEKIGRRIYWVCEFNDDELRERHEKEAKDVATRYPLLAVIRLNEALLPRDMKDFDHIRHLFTPV